MHCQMEGYSYWFPFICNIHRKIVASLNNVSVEHWNKSDIYKKLYVCVMLARDIHDAMLLAENRNQLQRTLERFYVPTKNMNLKINVSKTKAIVFSRKKNGVNDCKLT